MSTNPPVLPPSWGPAPNGRSAHALLEPLYAWADVTDDRLADLESQSGTSGSGVPIFGSQAEALAWEAANPGKVALWFDGGTTPPDPEDTPVTATGPTWTDDEVNGGGTWTTPLQTGVTYSPAFGTATPGQAVTVTATADTGYYLTGTTSWQHTFPTAPVAGDPAGVDTFASDTVGQPPAGWTTPWSTTGLNWEVVSEPTAIGGKALKIGGTDTTRKGYAWTGGGVDVEGEPDVEMLIKFKYTTPATTPGSHFRSLLRGSGALDSETGVYENPGTGTTAVWTYVAGTATARGSISAPGGLEDVWIMRRIRLVGDTISIRYWTHGNSEPETWHGSLAVAGAPMGGGWVGFVNISVSDEVLIDWVSVAVGGATAVNPEA